MIKCTEYYHPICVYMYIRTYIFAEVSAFSCSITRQNPSAKTTSRTAIVVDHDCIETLSPKMTVAWKASCRSEQSPSLSALAATSGIFHTIRDWNFIPKYLGHHFAPQECKHGSVFRSGSGSEYHTKTERFLCGQLSCKPTMWSKFLITWIKQSNMMHLT